MVSQTRALLDEPVYYHREYKNDASGPKFDETWIDQCKRVGFVALPFVSLYKPLSLPLSLAMGGLRTVTSVTTLIESINAGQAVNISLAVVQTGIAVIALASTLFAHPLGMVISTAHDLVIEVNHLIINLASGNCDYEKAIGSCLGIINNALYLSLFLDGGLELAIASLAMQILIGLYHSVGEFSNGNYLEGGGHLVMAMVRGAQLAGQASLLQTKWKLEEVKRAMEAEVIQEKSSKALMQEVDPKFIEVLMQYKNLVNTVNAQDIQAATLFLENGANSNERSDLEYAKCEWSDRHYGHQVRINEGMSPLDVAAKAGNVEMATLLLKFGADPTILRSVQFNQYSSWNGSPMHWAKKVEEPYCGYVSPIFVALRNKDYALLETFSKYGSDFNKLCFREGGIGQAPLKIAIDHADAKAVTILVGGGAKP
jgi:hypothetical protein